MDASWACKTINATWQSDFKRHETFAMKNKFEIATTKPLIAQATKAVTILTKQLATTKIITSSLDANMYTRCITETCKTNDTIAKDSHCANAETSGQRFSNKNGDAQHCMTHVEHMSGTCPQSPRKQSHHHANYAQTKQTPFNTKLFRATIVSESLHQLSFW